MVDGQWVSTGALQQAMSMDRIPEFNSLLREHLWVMVLLHRIDPTRVRDRTHTAFLDNESLLSITGPGCYWCEEPYTEIRAAQRCKGDPNR